MLSFALVYCAIAVACCMLTVRWRGEAEALVPLASLRPYLFLLHHPSPIRQDETVWESKRVKPPLPSSHTHNANRMAAGALLRGRRSSSRPGRGIFVFVPLLPRCETLCHSSSLLLGSQKATRERETKGRRNSSGNGKKKNERNTVDGSGRGAHASAPFHVRIPYSGDPDQGLSYTFNIPFRPHKTIRSFSLPLRLLAPSKSS